MSVINQMLKDLDQRKNKRSSIELQDTAEDAMAHPEDAKTATLLVPFLSLLCFMSTGGFGYLLLKQMNVAEVQPKAVLLKTRDATSNITLNLPEANTPETTTKLLTEPKPTAAPQKTARLTEQKQPETSQPITQQAPPVAHRPLPKIKAVATAPKPLKKVQKTQSVQTTDPEKVVTIETVTLSPIELSEQYYAEGKIAEKQGSMAEAFKAYHRALELNEQGHSVREAIVTLLLSEKKYGQAVFFLTESLQKYPAHEDYALMLIKLYEHLNRPKEALNLLMSLPPSTENKLLMLKTRVKLAHKLGDFRLTEQTYRELVQLQPENAKWWFGLGHALDNQSKADLAISIYEHTLEMNALSAQTAQYTKKRLEDLRGNQ
jgi:MSHA biogenesis protein MshN